MAPAILISQLLFAQGNTAVFAPVFGPQTVTRSTGKPVTSSFAFTLDPTARIDPPYMLAIQSDHVSSGSVSLNGKQLFGPSDFPSATLTAPVVLDASNTLSVELAGKPGSSLTVAVVGYQYKFAGDYALIGGSSPTTSAVSVDWVAQGVVTSVKNQGACQADWAFSATGAMEGNYAIKNGILNSLSEQDLLDCTPRPGSCDESNSPVGAFTYAISTGNGLPSETEYPYTAAPGVCKQSSAGTLFDPISGMGLIVTGDENALKTAVAAGTVSVVLNGNWYRTYTGGIVQGCDSTQPPVYSAALIVGYGVDSATSTPYWKVKNSLGSAWGEQGFFRIVRGPNACGIANFAISPVAR
jgi:hypothetical protein